MAVDITLDPIGRNFIPTVIGDPRFAQKGYLVGASATVGYWWVVLDPVRHPLWVWRKRLSVVGTAANFLAYTGLTAGGAKPGDYEKTALWLDMPGFSNGPMMELPDTADLAKLLVKKVGIWVLIGVLGGVVLSVIASGGAALVPMLAFALGGAEVGALAGISRAFMEWLRGGVPFGFVKGDSEWIDDPGMGYNGNLVSFGRGQSTAFSSYSLSPLKTSTGYAEAMGGLIPLVISYIARTTTPGPAFNQAFANLAARGGISGWALIPLDDPAPVRLPLEDGLTAGPLNDLELQQVDLLAAGGGQQRLSGVIMVAAKRPGFGELATYFASIGARDAVGMDGSTSVIMGSHATMFVGAIPFLKDAIQKYGFGTK